MPSRWLPARLIVVLLLVLVCSVVLSPPSQAASQPAPRRVGQIREYRLPTSYKQPHNIIAGPDGNLWFTGSQEGGEGYVGRITPTGRFTMYLIPSCPLFSSGITVGADGNIWVMACHVLTLVRIIPKTGQMTTFTFQFSQYSGEALTSGPDGNLWLAETAANNTIDRFSLKDHSLTSFAIPSQYAQVFSLSSGADGNLWFTETGTDKIGRLSSKTGQITEYPVPYQGESLGTITLGPKGDAHLWFVGRAGVLGWIDPFSGQISQVITPDGYAGPGLSAGPDGNLWYPEFSLIIRVTTGANLLFTTFAIPNKRSDVYAITSGPDGKMWFTDFSMNKIGTITTH